MKWPRLHGPPSPDGRRRHHRGSIFFRLLLILAVTGVLINLLVGGAFRMAFWRQNDLWRSAMQNVRQYTDYIVADIGEPPSLERARELSRRLSIDIKVESPQTNWSTQPGLPPIASLKADKHVFRHHGVPAGHVNGRYFLVVERGERKYLLLAASRGEMEPGWGWIALLLAALTLVLSASFLSIRRLLSPLDALTTGVDEIGRGNFAHTVPVRRHDELGRLARSFNEMTGKVRDMMQTKEQLLLDVSHELRSPLTRMKVGLEFVSDEKAKRRLAEEIAEMERMITELLESARLENPLGALQTAPVQVEPWLLRVAGKYADSSPGVQVAPVPKSLVLMADERRISVVLKNVLDNALKYSKPGGKPVEISVAATGNSLCIRIQDHGAGIPAGEMERVFEPFYRVDPSRNQDTGGFGLGLSLSRKIMRAHGGELRLESREGEGTTVTMVFGD